MPISFQASPAAQYVHGTVATMPADGVSADAQTAAGPGNAFKEILQVFVPSGTSGTGVSSEVHLPPKQTGSSTLSQPRPRKNMADVSDAAAQMLQFQLPPTVSAVPMADLASSQLSSSDTSQPRESETALDNNAGLQQAVRTEGSPQQEAPLTAEPAQEPCSSAMQIQAVIDLIQPLSNRTNISDVSATAQQPADGSLVTNSSAQTPQRQRAVTTSAATAAAFRNTLTLPAHRFGQRLHPTEQMLSTPDTTRTSDADIVTSPNVHIAASNAEVSLAQSPAASVGLATESSLQKPFLIPAMSADFISQGTPAVMSDVQASSGDGSSGLQDDADSDTSADRKAGSASTRLSMLSLDDGSRVGMNGWIASTQDLGNPSAQGKVPDVSLLDRSSGMTNLSLDRIAAGSSARRLSNALRSDMNFGVQTEKFGKINIQAALHGDQLASQISLEHAHLHASTLAAHMPGLELRLEDKFQLDVTVTVRDAGVADSNQQSSSQENRRRDAPDAPQHNLAVSARNTTHTSLPQMAATHQSNLLSRPNGRLDLLI